MILADTNLVIYIAQFKLKEQAFANHAIACSVITKIEALGYHRLPVDELRMLENLFANSTVLPMNEQIIQQAILVRQYAKMGLGDSIVAATALVHDLELWTANSKDFKHVNGLRLHDPTS